jgi:hypothetical protein
MTNLRPGRNEAVLAVNLLTRSDAACNPGWTGAAPTRFVLSSNSYIHLPDYARATTVPDLQVLTGSAWPYAEGQAVPVALGQGADSLVAAMTLGARIAAASGKVIDFNVVPQADLPPDGDVMMVMPTGAFSPLNLGRTGVTGATASSQGNDDALLDQFGTTQSQGPFSGIGDWLQTTMGLDGADLKLIPGADAPYDPAAGAVVISQVQQPEGGIWTILTAASGPTLVAGTERLMETMRWRQIGWKRRTSVLERATCCSPLGCLERVSAGRRCRRCMRHCLASASRSLAPSSGGAKVSRCSSGPRG